MQTLVATPTNLNNSDLSDPRHLLKALQDLRQSVYQEGQELFHRWRPSIKRKSFLLSALNLAYYLALRHHDLRPIQTALVPWGLSSLGRSESRVLPNLDAVITTLGELVNADPNSLPGRRPLRAFFRGDRLLKKEVEAVFGKTSANRQGRIMVTLPNQAATDFSLVLKLVECGSDCFRINCAHDNPEVWSAIIKNVRLASEKTGKNCKVFMDLAGPKPRTLEVVSPDVKSRMVVGDRLLLTRNSPHTADPTIPFRANCSYPEILDQLQENSQIWIDDGHVGTKVISLTSEGALLEVTHTRRKGEKLRPEKGLNFPDTVVQLCPLTEKDFRDLDFVALHADIIGYSFVQTATDISLLQNEIQKRLENTPRKIAIVAKVETKEAIRNLPEIMVQAAGKQPLGVMIARGDLAVEIGYQRLAEMQEEILWLCQSAHIPVIWATQVLENLAKTGIPSRAEMTDAAMGERAECVMLNKGPFINETVTILDDVLRRMEAHQLKKTPQLRALRSW